MSKRITGYVLAALLALLAVPVPGWAQGTPMPDVRIQFFDNNGLPCNGCLLNAYAAGTSTRQATYFSIDLADPSHKNANPVVLDSAGRPTTGYIYLSATTYRFVLTDSTGATQYWEADNTPSVPSTSAGVDLSSQTAGEALNAGDAVYISDGSGAKTAGRWYKADSANTYSSSYAGMVGFATTSIASAASGTIRIAGRMTGLAGLASGTTYYIGTAGALTATAPTNARKVGAADSTTTIDFSNQDYASVLQRTFRVNAATPYTETFPAADGFGALMSNGAGTLTFGTLPREVVEGRLTTTTGQCVSTTDVSATATIYFTPCGGSLIALYDGVANWNLRTFTEISISVTGCTASKPYDVFLYDNAGTVTEEHLVWTNDTTRATALVLQNGVLVKTGATTRRYVGSFYCNSTGGFTDDTLLKRYVYSYYHRLTRPLRIQEPADTWTYTLAAFHQVNGNAANQVDVMVGVAESTISLIALHTVNNTNGGVSATTGIGEDSSTVLATECINQVMLSSAGLPVSVMALLTKKPAVGRHTYVWEEFSSATGTATWYGDNGSATIYRNGVSGWIEQ